MNIYQFIIVISSLALWGCGSQPFSAPKRIVASSDFQCSLEGHLDKELARFVFTPEDLKLSISTAKKGEEIHFLSEDNFIAGGFSYVEELGGPEKNWKIKKVEFLSFVAKPKLSITFADDKVLTKECNPKF